MDAVVFLVIVAVVAIAGLALGLAIAPRLTAWDERRAHSTEQEAGPAEDDGQAEYDGVGPEAGRDGADGAGGGGD